MNEQVALVRRVPAGSETPGFVPLFGPEMTPETYTHNSNYVSMRALQDIEAIRDNYSGQVRHFTAWLRENGGRFDELSIERYFEHLNASGCSASTIRVRRQAVKKRIKQLLRFADMASYQRVEAILRRLDENPNTKAPKIQDCPVGSDKVISETEFSTLLAKTRSGRQRCFLRFLYVTGCRVSEMLGVKLSDVKASEKHAEIRVMGKGRKERKVRIPIALYSQLGGTFQGKTYLFETDSGQPYSRSYVSNQIKRIGRRALGREISAHTLRHSFVTRKVRAYPGLTDAISRYVGHADPAITLRMYSHNQLSDRELFDDVLFQG